LIDVWCLTQVDIVKQISVPEMQGFPVSRAVHSLIVGATVNLLILGIYYGATFGAGHHHKASLFLASANGFAVSYKSNRAWSFQFKGKRIGSDARFGAGYGASLQCNG
jgi:putative flippase GtrA